MQASRDSDSPGGGRRTRAAARLSGVLPALACGAALALSASEILAPGRVARLFALAAGMGSAAFVLLVLRLLAVPRGALVLLGAVLGPLPFALFLAATLTHEERIAVGLGAAVLGALVGALEAARRAERGRGTHAGG